MALPPLQFDPILVPKPWGGRELARLGRDVPKDTLMGESWDVADLASAGSVADPVSRVAAGPFAGVSLNDLVRDHPGDLLGGASAVGGRFPLLVKTLDARQHLSVQVHPPAAYVAKDPSVALKTESWIVLDAEPGSSLLLGLRSGVQPDAVAAALGTPALVGLLSPVPARVGDVHHLPAGLVHSLGAGIVVAEVQTPSDTTFRLYDWTMEYGRAPRELHLDQGRRAIELAWDVNTATRPVPEGGAVVATPHYHMDVVDIAGGHAVPTADDGPTILYVVSGEVTGPALALPTGPGSVVLVPAACEGPLRAVGATTVVVVRL